MAVKEKAWTYEDYISLEEDKRYDIVDERLFEMPTASLRHQKVICNLAYLFRRYQEEKSCGDSYLAPVDVILSEENIVQPDVVFISIERLSIAKERVILGARDMVAEVVYPSTFKRVTEDKRKLYAKHGVKEYWLVSPEEKVVEVLTLKKGEYEVFSHSFEKGRVCSKLLEGFCLNL